MINRNFRYSIETGNKNAIIRVGFSNKGAFCMVNKQSLACFLDDLWAKGFKLTDEDIQFIYFGKNFANASDWKVIFAVQVTLRFQHAFDGSFYLSVLDLIKEDNVQTKKQAEDLLANKGLQLQYH
jgi:Family of unknown function (DUF6123)